MPQLTTGTIIAGRYRLERVLAQGAMGSVWVGRHLQLDHDIAIKFMAPQLASSADLRARFEREAKAAALLKSPNAVHVYDYGIEDGAPYIVMELLEGEDLAARLGREPRLSLPVTREILEQASKALRRAHEIGLVHRDLKPGNLFLARQGGELVVKVVDFGIAKSTGVIESAQATRTGALLGSPSYMSPEQIRSSNNVDHRTDLWSLGVIAFRCVTGQLPFPSEELGEVLVDVCTAPIPVPSQVAPDLGPEVDAFFHRALMRDPARRFQSAAELVEAFAAIPGARSSLPPVSANAAQQGPGGTVVATNPGAHPPPVVQTTAPGARTAVVAPPPAPHPVAGTLSPSSQTRSSAAPPARGRRAGILIAAALGAVALGVGLFAYLRGPGSSAEPSGVSGEAAAAAASAAPEAPAAAPPSSSAAAPEAPSPDAARTAAPSASASSRSRPPARPGSPRPTPAKKGDDLLKHM